MKGKGSVVVEFLKWTSQHLNLNEKKTMQSDNC